jgi:transposase-like protein
MSTKSKKKAQTGVRYSNEEKQKVVDFVSEYNSSKGRGGQSVAAKKFKVTPLTIATWIKSLGKKAAAPSKAVKPVKAAKAAKPAKPAKAAGASKMGVRYSPEQKQEVVKFVQDYNAANGRGGQSRAADKFKLSVLTVSAWLKAAGVKGGKVAKAPKAAKVSKKAAKGAVVKAAKSSAAPAGLAAKVASLVNISEQVNQAEKELEKLYAKHDAIMASIKSWV